MTGLWTNDRATLAEGIDVHQLQCGVADAKAARATAQFLLDWRTVRVLDPDDTELRERLTRRLFDAELRPLITWKQAPEPMRERYRRLARVVIDALRQL
jgi:hypothetical protein